VSSLLQEVTAMSAHQRLRLDEYADQVKAKNCFIKEIQMGNIAPSEDPPSRDVGQGAER
jgi:hypothetical protein